MKFRKKPVVIDAVQWAGNNLSEIQAFYKPARAMPLMYDGILVGNDIHIHTLEGMMIANKGDWIIKGVKGEFYPCKPDIFEQTYEPVEEGAKMADSKLYKEIDRLREEAERELADIKEEHRNWFERKLEEHKEEEIAALRRELDEAREK